MPCPWLLLTLSRLDSPLGLHSGAAGMPQHWHQAVLQGFQAFSLSCQRNLPLCRL